MNFLSIVCLFLGSHSSSRASQFSDWGVFVLGILNLKRGLSKYTTVMYLDISMSVTVAHSIAFHHLPRTGRLLS